MWGAAMTVYRVIGPSKRLSPVFTGTYSVFTPFSPGRATAGWSHRWLRGHMVTIFSFKSKQGVNSYKYPKTLELDAYPGRLTQSNRLPARDKQLPPPLGKGPKATRPPSARPEKDRLFRPSNLDLYGPRHPVSSSDDENAVFGRSPRPGNGSRNGGLTYRPIKGTPSGERVLPLPRCRTYHAMGRRGLPGPSTDHRSGLGRAVADQRRRPLPGGPPAVAGESTRSNRTL